MHLFRAGTGLPLRRYALLLRLRAALAVALRGATLTEAAHAAGFSDSAHLSRTFREHFGLPPRFLFEHRDRLTVRFR
jgi:AraC-like DNA-binding protein